MKSNPAPCGILLLDKPGGPTSHDVVNEVRALFGTRRVGHAGTLDPFATGLMVVLVGQATRLSEYLVTNDKSYSGLIQLGVTTDTGDCTGTVTLRRACSVTAAGLERVRQELLGVSEQLPPMYSAVKVGGRRLHELARLGIVAERPSRKITIHELTLSLESSSDLPVVSFRVLCSKGTYVRVLAEEVGRLLGCGANVLELRRLMSGSWRLADAVRLDELAAMEPEVRVEHLAPLAAALPEMNALTLETGESELVASGIAVTRHLSSGATQDIREGNLVKLLTSGGDLAAISLVTRQDGADTLLLRPKKVFL